MLESASPVGDEAVAAKYRDLTISWSRYDYHGPILEAGTVDDVLGAAAATGARYCFVLAHGQVIRERWIPDAGGGTSFLGALETWADGQEFLVAGRLLEEGSGYGLDASGLLVDLERYRALGQPPFGDRARGGDGPALPGWRIVARSLEEGLPVRQLPPEIQAAVLDLAPDDARSTAAFSRYLNGSIERYGQEEDEELSAGQRLLLDTVSRQARSARRGVFLWNIESYADVEQPPDWFPGPVSTLYSVAAGFKPNRILHTHGFDGATRVVFYDYSERALEIRQELVESWDGEDFPTFVRHLFRRFPPPGTFYQLWADLGPEDLKASDLESAWQRELERWGGADVFREHWQATRRLPHQYLHCDLTADPDALFELVSAQPGAVIWWSNAFFTMYSNWYRSLTERRASYERFAARLADLNPNLLLYGSDHDNTNINYARAAEYWHAYRGSERSELRPTPLNRHTIRM